MWLDVEKTNSIRSGRPGENSLAIRNRWPFEERAAALRMECVCGPGINTEIIPLLNGTCKEEYLKRQFERA